MHVTVIVPAFNVAAWVGGAIASVVAQSYLDWSLVVVDDGSTDHTAEVVEQTACPRVRLIRQANAGVSVARNRGLAAVVGRPAEDSVLFLDADDWLAPDALARLAGALRAAHGSVAAVAPFIFVPEGAAVTRKGSTEPHGVTRARRPAGGNLLPRLLERNLFANGGHVLVRRSALERAGEFRPGLAYGEDWELWCRLALLGPFARTAGRHPALFVRQRASGATLRMGSEPASFRPCMDAIFHNPDLLARYGPEKLSLLRRRTEAENGWIIGRELLRHGRAAEGRAWLRRSARTKPSLKRAALLAVAYGARALPSAAQGPFRTYTGLRPAVAPSLSPATGAARPLGS